MSQPTHPPADDPHRTKPSPVAAALEITDLHKTYDTGVQV